MNYLSEAHKALATRKFPKFGDEKTYYYPDGSRIDCLEVKHSGQCVELWYLAYTKEEA